VARNYAAAAEITKGRQVWLMVALMYDFGSKGQTESPNVPTGSNLGTMAGTKQVESSLAVWFATAGKADGLKTHISIAWPVVVVTRLDCGMMTSKQDVGQGVDPAGRHVHQVAAAALIRGRNATDGSWKQPPLVAEVAGGDNGELRGLSLNDRRRSGNG
jgi:hypothetical protein